MPLSCSFTTCLNPSLYHVTQDTKLVVVLYIILEILTLTSNWYVLVILNMPTVRTMVSTMKKGADKKKWWEKNRSLPSEAWNQDQKVPNWLVWKLLSHQNCWCRKQNSSTATRNLLKVNLLFALKKKQLCNTCSSRQFWIWFVVHLFSGFSLARLNEKHGTDTGLVSTSEQQQHALAILSKPYGVSSKLQCGVLRSDLAPHVLQVTTF
jgi:hypothetical protein